MKKERMEELLAYAAVCFDNCTSPFETMHLAKKNVSLDECGDISMEISDILKKYVSDDAWKLAQIDFKETQEVN